MGDYSICDFPLHIVSDMQALERCQVKHLAVKFHGLPCEPSDQSLLATLLSPPSEIFGSSPKEKRTGRNTGSIWYRVRILRISSSVILSGSAELREWRDLDINISSARKTFCARSYRILILGSSSFFSSNNASTSDPWQKSLDVATECSVWVPD